MVHGVQREVAVSVQRCRDAGGASVAAAAASVAAAAGAASVDGAVSLGGVPIGAFHEEPLRKALELPDQEEPLYLIPVGVPR